MESISSPSHGPQSFVTPLLLSLAGIAGTSMVLVAYNLIVVKYCIRRRRRASFLSPPIQEGDDMGIGVEEHVLKALPILSFSTEKCESLRLDQSECVICLGELEEGDEVRLLPNCGHLFHVPCIDDWFLAHTSCPICRAPIIAPLALVVNEPIGHHGREGAAQDHQFAQFLDQRDSGGGGTGGRCGGNASSPAQPNGNLLRHSISLVLPMEEKSQSLMKLKRSLSLDQSYVIIDIQRESDQKASCSCYCSCSSSLKGVIVESRSNEAPSINQFDRLSSRLLRSFSQMQVDQRIAANGILPR